MLARRVSAELFGTCKKQLDVGGRRACKVLGQLRSIRRYQSTKSAKDKAFTEEMHELARENTRFGYRRITELDRRGGQRINEKRIHRLWKQAGLQVPSRKRKRRLIGTSKNESICLTATRPNQVWSYDFVHDRTEDGRSITSCEVISKLEELFEVHGRPALRQRPEFLAEAVAEYVKE